MKLRFRGARWDASVAAASGVPPSVQIGVPQLGTRPDEVLSLHDFLQKEGVLPGFSLPLRRRPRPLPSTDLAPWPCAVAIQRDGAEEDTLCLRFEGSGEPGVVGDSELLGNKYHQGVERWSQESPQGCHRDGVAALPTPVCCIISIDPTIAMESQRSFINFVLTDQQLRSHLLSEAGMQLGAQGGGLFAAACTDQPLAYPRAAGPIDISHDQSLSGILERLRGARSLPGGEERCLPRVETDCASQRCFELITEDFDELVPFPPGRIRPDSGNGTWCSPEVGANETAVQTDNASEAHGCPTPGAARWSMPLSSWDALCVRHLLKPWSMPRVSELTTDYALSPLWATPAEPRAMRIERPTKPEPTRRRGSRGDDTMSAEPHQALGSLRKLAEEPGNGFMRINVDDSAGCGDLQLQSMRKGLGLLDVLGDEACGIYVAAAGIVTFDTVPAAENSHRNFQPANPTPAILRQGLFPERYPQIPLAVVGAATSGRERRGKRQTQKPKASSLGTRGGKRNAQRAHQHILAMLWGAIRETNAVSSSSLTSKPGAGLDFAARRTYASTRFGRPASLSTKAGWRAGDAPNVVTNGLLVNILASWRHSHAQACVTDPTTNAKPHRKSDAVPVASQLPITAPFQAPPKPTLEPTRHTTFPSNDGEPASSDTLRSQLGQAPSTVQSGGKLARGVVKEPAGTAEEPVDPVNLAGASASTYTKAGAGDGGEHALAISAHSKQRVGVSDGEPDCCTTQGGSGAVLGGQESWHRVKAAGSPEESLAVPIDEGRFVEPAVDSGRKRRRFDEPSTGNEADDEAIPMTHRHRSSGGGGGGGGGSEGARSELAEPTLAKRRPSERASLPPIGAVPHRPRRMRASTGSFSTHSPVGGVVRTTEGKSGVGPSSCGDVLAVLSLLPANAQDDGKRHSSSGEDIGRRTIPSHKATYQLQSSACPQQTGVCTSGDVARAHQPRPPEVLTPPPRQAAISSVKSKPECLMDDLPVAAPPWMGRAGDCPSGQETPERPGHVEPSASTAEESKKSPIRCQGTKGPGGDVEDVAMAGCGSRRQREMLALIRAGSVEGTFALTRGCDPSGYAGKGAWMASAPLASNALVGRSGSRGPSGVAAGVSTGLASSDPEVRSMRDSNRSGGQADRPLYAIVSEELVGRAGSLVIALSTPQRGPKVEAPFNTMHRVPAHKASGAPRPDRFALLELPVEPPVDLVVGGRSAVVIFDSRNVPPIGCGGGRGRDPSEVGVSEEALAEAEMAEAKKKLHLLTLQTLKYSTLWIILRMEKVRGGGAVRGGTLVCPAFEMLEQWLVGFPCRVLIRYSSNEAHLAELITHAALAEQRLAGTAPGTGTASTRDSANRRRSDPSPREAPALSGRSPLEAIEHRSRDDPDWAAVHHRQAWFLQLFPALNAYSASALLSSASLKHLIVAPFEELAPCLLGKARGTEGGGSGGGAARGGVGAESLRDFCAAVRLEEGSKVDDMSVVP